MSVNCDYCGKAIDRKVFCSPSHKVLYHRSGPLKADPEKSIEPKFVPNVETPFMDLSKTKQASHGGLRK
jgi:hypothetical protein